MAVIDPKKLLPESSKTTSILVPKKNVSIAPASAPSLKPVDGGESVGGKLVVQKLIKIDEVLKDTLRLKAGVAKAEEKEKKEDKREAKEKALESQKDKKKKTKKMFTVPKAPGLDWLSNWLTWTFAGWLFNNFKSLLNYLEPIMGVLTTVGKAVVKIFTVILEGVIGFIDLGYKAYKGVEGLIEGLGGEDAKNVFNDMTGALTTAMNVAIIALMLAASTGGIGGKKPGGGNKPGRSGSRTRGSGGRPRVTQSGGGNANRFGLRNPLRQRPGVTQGGAGTRVTQAVGNRLTGRGAARVTTGAGGKVAGKLGLKAAGKALKPILSRVPFVGGLLEFFLSWALGDPIGKAAFRGVGMTLGSWIGGLLGTLIPIPFVGSAIGAFLGGMGAAELAGLMYDGIFGGKNAPQPKVEKKQGGGTVGSTQKPNRRGRGVKKVKRKTKVSKVNKVDTIVGKDFGSKKDIEKFYGKDEGFFGFGAKQNTPFDALVQSSIVAKENKSLNGVVGSLIGTGIDLTLGQKPSSKTIDEISNTLSTFVQASMQMEMDKTVQSVKDLFTMQEGGAVPARTLSRRKEDPIVRMKQQLTQSISESIGKTSREVFTKIRMAMTGKTQADAERERQEAAAASANAGNNQYGDLGTVTGGSADFWTLVAVAGEEDGDPQAWADVAQSVYNRQKAGSAYGYPGGPSLKGLLLQNGQYEPTWKYPKFGTTNVPNPEWHAITDAESAAAAMSPGTSVAYVEKVAAAIMNPTLRKNAAEFVGGRTDFMGGNEKPNFAKGDVRRRDNMPNNFFGWFVGDGSKAYGRTKPGAASAPDLEAMRVAPPTPSGSGSIDSAVKGNETGLLSLSGGVPKNLPAGSTLSSTQLHHGSEDIRAGLKVRDYFIGGISGPSNGIDGLGARLYTPLGFGPLKYKRYDPFGMTFVDPNTGKDVGHYYHVVNPQHQLHGKIIPPGTFVGTQGGLPGTPSGNAGNSSAVHLHVEGTVAFHNALIATYAGGAILKAPKSHPSSSYSPPSSPQSSQSPQSPQSSGPSKFTKASINSFFGASEEFRGGKPHEGIDIEAKHGTKISFSVGGTIIASYPSSSTSKDSNGGYGAFVDLKLDNGKIIRMSHLSKIYPWVKSGAKFGPNEVVALSGGKPGSPGAGRSGGPHIHFEQHEMSGLGIEETMENKVNPISAGAFNYIQKGGTLRQNISSLQTTPEYASEAPPTILYQKELVMVG